MSTILITGGAGFIGINFILDWVKSTDENIVNLDKLTYAGNLHNLVSLTDNPQHIFVHGDICDSERISILLERYQPRAIIHMAAESHVDRSIHGPEDFIQTNITGTFQLLEAARHYWGNLSVSRKENFRFLHVSTDEVFGTLAKDAPTFTENHCFQPNSPYSASKASSDCLVRAYHHTYGLPVLTTHCSNNYGAYQFPEKLIPLIIVNALAGKPLPVYGDGQQIRDWLYVNDHCQAIRVVLEKGQPGETYNIGGWNEKSNLEIIHTICDVLQQFQQRDYRALITHVADRPGHDRRYAINAHKIERELGWKPLETFETGIRKTIQWYLENHDWVAEVQSGDYRQWVEINYTGRSQ
ncbi:dTDP-glucose 4,6-dehydratase [Nitrosomonas eutropha]|uniref:dTDP-glucose 4,6-dehydratase n=1 Tax=Nitrosomonas eutropha TaxID=916 RepID=A0A1I7HJQ5_9PROT|nr:dTDP-glucose 4,6-dehydratase [Nitrosomonas eutropha]SFU60923.1 dTDP-glucose 4,6-dehydratase [Nitrosomonas eutropha]